MKSLLAVALLGCGLVIPNAHAQGSNGPFPGAVLRAKTVVILNDTHTQTVEDGAEAALKQWGHFQVIDDVDAADIVLHFTKSTTHSTSNSQSKNDKDDSTSYSFNVSSSSSVHMTATARGSSAEFYSTSTDDGKQKAGRECAQAFIGAFQDAVRGK